MRPQSVGRAWIMTALLVTTLTSGWSSAQDDGEPSGASVVVAAVEGKVQVNRVGAPEWIAATRGMKLHDGDKIRALEGGDASLLVGSQPLRLSSLPGRAWTSGKPTSVAPGFVQKAWDLVNGGRPAHAIAGAEFRGLPGGCSYRPLRGRVVADRIQFEWRPVKGARQYRLAVREMGANDPNPIVTVEVPDTHIALPPGQLQTGKSYLWTLEPIGGGRAVNCQLTVASPREIEMAYARGGDDLARADALQRAGFNDAALAVCSKVLEANPGNEAMRRRLTDLLRRSGAKE
ncbi:MAG: hypothetical protein HY815_25260 [Candidatus Riflebacteria bacterium]|nr:hypothetical protein [Candidatus Riflebacteria bacterium]